MTGQDGNPGDHLATRAESWELIHDVLDDANWQAKIPASFPKEAVEPPRTAICFVRPAENFPPGTTRAELNATAEAPNASQH